ncbi:hypothetical protein [Spirosoma fluviale]|uniref:Uncharacterized protein n=1 Tax=Spirosoma fluviale TaxID=1597977 RepID=A0A286FGB6_9BACT|nr:hypothetical protein [Spirosoma fluviale]SOD82291.1 hypothetical protein SAMN06269250_2088 [Spirosoma fluviale]
MKTSNKHSLPPIPTGFGLPFYYATLFNIEVAFLVEQASVIKYLSGTGLRAADFDGKAMVSFNYQQYTGQFPNGSSNTQEIELNIVCYPKSQAKNVAFVTAEQYLRGEEQTKLMGHHRVWVPCDSDTAIQAGIQLFGEPKFKTTFATSIPSLNVPDATTWTVTCNDPVDPAKAIFTCVADVRQLQPQLADGLSKLKLE